MTTFRAFHSNNISPNSTNLSADGAAHNNPHAVANGADVSAFFQLVQDQFTTYARDADDDEDERRTFLQGLAEELQLDILNPPRTIHGVNQEFLDSLDRVPKKSVKKTDDCPICAEPLLADEYPLIVRLPCHRSHVFDLECVSPWLLAKGTCPICRTDFVKEKAAPEPDAEAEYDDPAGMFY